MVRQRLGREEGVALVIALMSLALMMALATSLLLITMTETRIAASYRDGIQALYAADAAIERVLPDLLAAAPAWDDVLAGAARSTFVDGEADGVRRLADGTAIGLVEETHQLRAEGNPRWQLYGYGWIASVLPAGRTDSRLYVAVWLADDRPTTDGVLNVLARAYGPQGVSRAVEVTVERAPGALRVLSWKEVR
jgi:type IV pilus assembly PilX-like protein